LIGETVSVTIDASPDNIATGKKGYKQMAYACTVIEWYVLSDASGTIQFDVLKSTFAGYPSTTSIVGSDYPKLTAQSKNSNTSVNWTAVDSGDLLEFEVTSNADVKKASLFLKVQRTA
jgi:hypothetical protein